MVIRRQTSQKTKRPSGQGPPRQHRIQMNRDTKRLCKWVQRRKGLSNPPSLNKALAGKYISYFAK